MRVDAWKGGGAYIVAFLAILVVEARVLIYVKFGQSEVDDVHLLGLEVLLFNVDAVYVFCWLLIPGSAHLLLGHLYFLEQEVFRLDVAMNNALVVHVPQAVNHFIDNQTQSHECEFPMLISIHLLNAGPQLLHDEDAKATFLPVPVDFRHALNSLQMPQDLKFLIQTIENWLALQLDLDGNFLSMFHAYPFVYDSKSTIANPFLQFVFALCDWVIERFPKHVIIVIILLMIEGILLITKLIVVFLICSHGLTGFLQAASGLNARELSQNDFHLSL